MDRSVADEVVAVLRQDLPEFEERVLDLLELYGEDLTVEILLMELADFVTGLLVICSAPGTLDRCFALADEMARSFPGGGELVAYALLNEIPPAARDLARPHLSSALDSLLGRLERGEAAGPAAEREAEGAVAADDEAEGAAEGSGSGFRS